MPKFLSGKAKRAFDALTNKTTIKEAVDGLVKALAKPQEVLLITFYERRRKPHESISKFATALQELLHKACPDMIEAQRLPFLRSQLCLSLPEHMRAIVQFNVTMSWDNLVSSLEMSLPQVSAHSNESIAAYGYMPLSSSPPLIKQEPSIDNNYNKATTTMRS